MVKENPTVTIEDGEKDQFQKIADLLRSTEESERVDEGKLLEISKLIDGLSPATRKAFMDLPTTQALIEKIAQDDSEGKPGTYKKVGLFNIKIPWKGSDLDNFKKIKVSFETKKMVIWNGIRFDIPADTEVELPEPVYQVILDQRAQEREMRRYETYGYEGGVKKLQDGWAGKSNEDKKE